MSNKVVTLAILFCEFADSVTEINMTSFIKLNRSFTLSVIAHLNCILYVCMIADLYQLIIHPISLTRNPDRREDPENLGQNKER